MIVMIVMMVMIVMIVMIVKGKSINSKYFKDYFKRLELPIIMIDVLCRLTSRFNKGAIIMTAT